MIILEEKLALSQAAYNDTKMNLEISDSKLSKLANNCANMIDELKIEKFKIKIGCFKSRRKG